jgi:2-oxoacid:acceptor oxidoreductase gamma subunit (pyruvate/2-ketoisovalerate family)
VIRAKRFREIVMAVSLFLLRKMYILDFPITMKDSWRESLLKKILEVRWHGRGGQGAWTASELLARAAIYEGKYIQSFPEFGPERMGAPVTAFTRISTEPIQIHCAVYNPDIVAVLDPTLMKAVPFTEGIKDDGIIVINSKDDPAEIRKALSTDKGKVWTVPATDISMKILGMPITNTAMLGAVAHATGIVNLGSIEKVTKERFKSGIAEKNFAVINEAYRETKSE